MKTKITMIFFIIITIVGCKENKPFKPALERVILEATDSLRKEIGNNKILSIEFNSDKHFRNADFKIFLTDSYSSIYIDGFVKYKGVIIAIYNLNDDYCELINKNQSLTLHLWSWLYIVGFYFRRTPFPPSWAVSR